MAALQFGLQRFAALAMHAHQRWAGITGQALSDIFARHARNDDDRDYALDLAGLPGQALSGMLTGYIDRLVRADGRWGVVDWKSNYLGPRYADYSRQTMWRTS